MVSAAAVLMVRRGFMGTARGSLGISAAAALGRGSLGILGGEAYENLRWAVIFAAAAVAEVYAIGGDGEHRVRGRGRSFWV